MGVLFLQPGKQGSAGAVEENDCEHWSRQCKRMLRTLAQPRLGNSD